MQTEQAPWPPMGSSFPLPYGGFTAPPAPHPPPMAAPLRRGHPFRDAEACIFWTIRRLAEDAAAKTEGRRVRRRDEAICTPGEVVKCLDTLYRRRRIDLHHVRILRLWAHRGRAPNRSDPMERADWRIWREVLDRLDWPLRCLGIID